MDGLILVHKPQNLTSHDVVAKIRKILNIKKAGHFGSLDPLATGLLVIAVGKATRLFPFYVKEDKAYEGQIRLGYSTDTYDSFGKPTSEEADRLPDEKQILTSLKKFEGEIEQIPPLFSAKKYKGKPLYALAREKKEIKLSPSNVIVYKFQMIRYDPPLIDIEVECSSGTYIRSLAHDLGEMLRCGAHLCQLKRTKVGNLHLKDCSSLEKIESLAQEGKAYKVLLPLEDLLSSFPKIILDKKGSTLARNGNLVTPANIINFSSRKEGSEERIKEEEMIFRIFDLHGTLIALARAVPEKSSLHPFLVIDSDESNH
jgi:tRNA pseudouridine55 synthase